MAFVFPSCVHAPMWRRVAVCSGFGCFYLFIVDFALVFLFFFWDSFVFCYFFSGDGLFLTDVTLAVWSFCLLS